MNNHFKIKKVLSIFAGLCVAVIFATPYILFKEEISSLSTFGYIGLFLSCLISNLSIFLPSSSTIIIVAAASTLNPWLCIIFGGLGTAFGEQASYLCGFVSSSGFKSSNSIVDNYVSKWFEKKPFITIFLFALAPLPVFDIAGIVAGTKKMTWWKYTMAAAFGKMSKFFIVVIGIYYFFPLLLEKLPRDFGNVVNGYFNYMF